MVKYIVGVGEDLKKIRNVGNGRRREGMGREGRKEGGEAAAKRE
jgi:hypothetical protein